MSSYACSSSAAARQNELLFDGQTHARMFDGNDITRYYHMVKIIPNNNGANGDDHEHHIHHSIIL